MTRLLLLPLLSALLVSATELQSAPKLPLMYRSNSQIASIASAGSRLGYAKAAIRLRGGEIAVAPSDGKPVSLRGGSKVAVKVPKEVQLLVGAAGIFLSFSVFAVLQEDVYKKAYGPGGSYFASTFFALVCERGINALTALIGNLLLGPSGLIIPHQEIFKSGISQMLAMAASNEALRYVSYPTQVLGKSCKMVPVMAGGLIVGGQKYSLLEYIQVLLITVGVVVFNFGGKKKKTGKADSPLGLFLIGGSLLMDAVTGGLQDKVKVRTKELNPGGSGAKRPSMHESMLWTNLSGCLMALVLAILTGQLVSGFQFCQTHPEVLRAIVVYSIASAVGQNFIYFTITQFNPLVLTTVTTTRKIFSTLFSVFRNPSNSLSSMQWTGCSLVFAGLLGDIGRKFAAKPKAVPPPPPPPPPPKLPPASADEQKLAEKFA